MVDTLKRLSGPTALTTSAVTQYTVPASTTTTIRNIHVANETATTATFTMSIGTDGAGKRLYKDVDVPGKGFIDWSGVEVLAAAEVIQALAGTASALTLAISGVETDATIISSAGGLTLLPITAPAAPASGVTYYVDSADSKTKIKKANGDIIVIG